ncbi:Alanine--tRNA ligase [Gossypium arboreum]|uniref:Alanine--tRNA ligase n=1 Tax=Gossypium arboreum TaxID=29729 RepID=A0A0B0MPH5_GOSAR|nr:Alanine--tRNA ligase [Gossypium arboreum]
MGQNQTKRAIFKIHMAWPFPHGLSTCLCNPHGLSVSISLPVSQTRQKSQFLGFLSILKSINTR